MTGERVVTSAEVRWLALCGLSKGGCSSALGRANSILLRTYALAGSGRF